MSWTDEIEEEIAKVWQQLRGVDVSSQRFADLEAKFNRLVERRFWVMWLKQPGMVRDTPETQEPGKF